MNEVNDTVMKIQADPRMAYSLKSAATLLDMGYSTLRKEVAAGKITPGNKKKIGHDELLRYANMEFGPKERPGRKPGLSLETIERNLAEKRCPSLGLVKPPASVQTS